MRYRLFLGSIPLFYLLRRVASWQQVPALQPLRLRKQQINLNAVSYIKSVVSKNPALNPDVFHFYPSLQEGPCASCEETHELFCSIHYRKSEESEGSFAIDLFVWECIERVFCCVENVL